MKCVENFALSYVFPTCMKFEFLSSDRDITLVKFGCVGELAHAQIQHQIGSGHGPWCYKCKSVIFSLLLRFKFLLRCSTSALGDMLSY